MKFFKTVVAIVLVAIDLVLAAVIFGIAVDEIPVPIITASANTIHKMPEIKKMKSEKRVTPSQYIILVEVEEPLPELHYWTLVEYVSPTYDTDGYTKYVCVCGEELTIVHPAWTTE